MNLIYRCILFLKSSSCEIFTYKTSKTDPIKAHAIQLTKCIFCCVSDAVKLNDATLTHSDMQ